MLSLIKNNLVFFVLSISLLSCNEEAKTKKQKSECQQITNMIESCAGLHEGALNYLDNCGSLSLDQAKSYDSCEELLEYTGFNEFIR